METVTKQFVFALYLDTEKYDRKSIGQKLEAIRKVTIEKHGFDIYVFAIHSQETSGKLVCLNPVVESNSKVAKMLEECVGNLCDGLTQRDILRDSDMPAIVVKPEENDIAIQTKNRLNITEDKEVTFRYDRAVERINELKGFLLESKETSELEWYNWDTKFVFLINEIVELRKNTNNRIYKDNENAILKWKQSTKYE